MSGFVCGFWESGIRSSCLQSKHCHPMKHFHCSINWILREEMCRCHRIKFHFVETGYPPPDILTVTYSYSIIQSTTWVWGTDPARLWRYEAKDRMHSLWKCTALGDERNWGIAAVLWGGLSGDAGALWAYWEDNLLQRLGALEEKAQGDEPGKEGAACAAAHGRQGWLSGSKLAEGRVVFLTSLCVFFLLCEPHLNPLAVFRDRCGRSRI